MRDRDRSAPFRPGFRPSSEWLEARALLTITSQQVSSQIALVQHEYDGFVGELRTIELQSQATPAEYLALRDDARAISEAAVPSATAANKAVEVSIQLDLSPLEGWLGDTGWATVQSTLTANLAALGISGSLTDQTLADMKTLAESAGVTADEYASYSSDLSHLREGEASLQGAYAHFPDPNVYYTQHLRGFFRGGASSKAQAQATLAAELASVSSGAGSAVLHRDANLLESIGSGIPSTADDQLGNEFANVFASGPPSSAALSQLGSQIESTLGKPGASPTGSVARLLADAPKFYQAAGSSATTIARIVVDVRSVVDAGGDSRLNPFVVTVR